jgi:hypothetical protein
MTGSGDRSLRRVSNNVLKGVIPKTHFEVLSNLTNETLEGKLADKKFGGLLVATNFTESDSSGAEAMGLLHATSDSLTKAE